MVSSGIGPPPAKEAAPASFADFYRRHYEAMLRLAYLLTRSRPTAEDAVQDAFLRVHGRWETIREPVPYTRRAVVNACHSHHRRRRRELAGPHPSPPEPVIARPDEMWDALAQLAPRRRAVLVLRFYMDMSEADTASALKCRPGTVKSLTSRALDDLRRVIER